MRELFAVLFVLSGIGGCSSSKDDTTIVPYGRENNSGTYLYFKEHVLGKEDFAANVQTLQGTGVLISAVSSDRRGVGYGGIGYVKGVRTLAVKKDAASPAFAPTAENVLKSAYPISRYLYFYTIGEPQGAARHFVDWAMSEEGQKVCEQVGYFPLPKDQWKTPGAPAGEKTTLTIKGSDTMVILGARWAEEYMKKFPAVTIQITGGGSGTGIKALKEGSTHICQSSRPMTAREKKEVKEKQGKESVEFAVALDALAVFVHESNSLREITLDQLKGIYTGKIKDWKELVAAQ